MEQLKKWIVNDYFTPNIKAEVVLDTLLTDHVAGIIKAQCKDKVNAPQFITKEMSVFDMTKQEQNTKYGNRGTKIDYILAGPDDPEDTPVYLVELKTTDSSLKEEQAKRYLQNCKDKSFGAVFGDHLLRIVLNAFGNTYQNKFNEKNRKEDLWNDQTLLDAFDLVFEEYGCRPPRSNYADAALSLIKKAGWTRSGRTCSRKYLYTMGQLLDYLYPKGRKGGEIRKLWRKDLRLIYLTPTGHWPSNCFKDQPDFYLHPADAGSVSLQKAVEYLEAQKEELAQILAETIKEIYPA